MTKVYGSKKVGGALGDNKSDAESMVEGNDEDAEGEDDVEMAPPVTISSRPFRQARVRGTATTTSTPGMHIDFYINMPYLIID
jgi:hypothetical protein